METDKKIKVNFFQRKPRKGFSFSLEYVFEDLRERLKNKIEANVFISKCFHDGYLTKFINIIEASFRQQKDINHITGEVHFLNLLMKKGSVILTIMDCGMMVRKTGIAKKIVKWLYLTAPITKAKYITAISEETRKEIIAYTNCNPDKIKVMPVAIYRQYQPYHKKFNLQKPVVLHIGTGYNKNLLRLIQALRGVHCHLTIVGKLSQEYIDALSTNNIEYSNEYNISSKRLLQKYQECDILAFISTFEGFGMPIVEANAVERAVITSNISSMPEIAGNAACLVDPYNVEEIRTNIAKLIENKTYRESLIENGRINKLRFDGNRIALQYYDLYKSMISI